MKEIKIRRVERRDLDGCFLLEKRCYDLLEVAPRDFIEKRIEIYPDGFYVAEYMGEIVGMVNSGATHKDDITDEELKYLIGHVRNGRNGVVFSLAVHPDHRGRGIAGMLMEKLIDSAEQKEKQKILLLCRDSLIDFYKSLGFSYSGPASARLGADVLHQMHFELPLPAWIAASHHNSTSPALQ